MVLCIAFTSWSFKKYSGLLGGMIPKILVGRGAKCSIGFVGHCPLKCLGCARRNTGIKNSKL
jgi:hypothetical protein